MAEASDDRVSTFPFITHPIVRGIVPRILLSGVDRIMASPLGARLAKGMYWAAFGSVTSRGLALIAAVVTARIVGKEVFGEFGIIQSTMLMFGSFGLLSMGLTATKHVAEHRRTDPARMGRVIGMSSMISWVSGSVMALIVIALAPWLAANTLAAPHLSGLLRLAAVGMLLNVVAQAQLGTQNGFEAFRQRSMIDLTVGLVSLPLTVAGVYFWGLQGVVGAQICAQAVLVFLNFRAISREAKRYGVSIRWKGSFQEARILWLFSLPTFMGGLLYVPVVWLANTLIVHTGNGYAEMGLFSAADRWRTAIMFFPTLLGGVALPMLTGLRAEDDFKRYRKVLWTNVKAGALAALSMAIPIAILSPWIMAGYGPEFVGGEWVLVVLSVSCVIASADWIMGQSLFSSGDVWLKFWSNAGWAGILLLCAWFLRDRGAMGLAVAYLVSYSVRFVAVFSVMSRRRSGF